MTLEFATPWALACLLLIPALAMLPRWANQQFRPAGLTYASDKLISSTTSRRLRIAPFIPAVRLFALALLIVAIARPQAVEGQEVVTGEGVDIAIALDISGSMDSLDFQPRNRLEAAKRVIDEFVAERRHDRIGLVVFARQAFIQSPPTVDHDVLSLLLSEVRLATDLGIQDGTAIGLGLASAANLLKDSAAKGKVVVLLTDGINNSGAIDPTTAAMAAKTLGMKVHTIGMGRPGLVPVTVRTRFGEQTILQESELDEETLRRIAATTDGRYFRATDTEALREIYHEINRLEKSNFETRVYSRYQELAGWLLVPALMLLCLDLVLRHTLFRRLP